MTKRRSETDCRNLKIAFRFLGIALLTCFLCLIPTKHTSAKEIAATESTATYYAPPINENSSIEKMEQNNQLLQQMKKEQKELNQTYKEKITACKNSSVSLTETQTKELHHLNKNIRKKNKQLKNNLSKLTKAQKRYEELEPTSAKAKKSRKNIISLQKNIIKCMKKINRLFKKEIRILDSIQN